MSEAARTTTFIICITQLRKFHNKELDHRAIESSDVQLWEQKLRTSCEEQDHRENYTSDVVSWEQKLRTSCEEQDHREKVPGLSAPVLPFLGATCSLAADEHFELVGNRVFVHKQLNPKKWKS